MNSWQSAGEAHKNKPVVQFLAMVMRLEIIAGNWGSLKVRIQQLGQNKPYFLGIGNAPGAAHRHQPGGSRWYPGAGHPWSGGIWELCVLSVSLEASPSSPAPSLGRWLMDAFVYSCARGLFSKGGDCLPLCGIWELLFCGICTKPAAGGGCFKGHFSAFDTSLQENEPRLCLPWNIWAGISSVPPVIMRCQGRCASRGWEFTLVQGSLGGFKIPGWNPWRRIRSGLEWRSSGLKSPLKSPQHPQLRPFWGGNSRSWRSSQIVSISSMKSSKKTCVKHFFSPFSSWFWEGHSESP